MKTVQLKGTASKENGGVYKMPPRGRRRTAAGAVIVPEKNVQSSIITFLNRAKIVNNRVNGAQVSVSGENKRGNSTSRRIRCSSMNGKADVEGWSYMEHTTSGRRIGVMLYIEVKASSGGRQSDDQKAFELMLKERGYHYCVARSVKDVYDFIIAVRDEMELLLPGWKMYTGRARIE